MFEALGEDNKHSGGTLSNAFDTADVFELFRLPLG